MLKASWKAIFATTLALCCVAFCGCEPKDGFTAVKGTVTFDGEPLKEGYITFAPKGGAGTTSGAQIVDGKYEARVTPGTLGVAITADKKEKIENPTHEQIERGITEVSVSFIPAKYNTQSTLEATVAEGQKDPIDFELTSEE